MIKKIKNLISTPLRTNNYLLFLDGGAVLIEASATVEQIERELGGEKLLAVILTHSHFDHAINLENILKHFDVACYLHELAVEKVKRHEKQFYGDKSFKVEGCDDKLIKVEDKQTLQIANQPFEFMYTPGHTDDSLCVKVGEILFSGDTLFYGSIGRCDLPSGNEEDMKKTLKKVFMLDDDVLVLPGHGEQTNISAEKLFWGEIL